MKKFILSLSVCSMVLFFSACTENLVIPDANFKTYLLENFDKNKDGEISLSEAEKVKEINCSGKNIDDLTGIEKFENLESLDCSNNNLIELEIRYNKKLNKLVCKGNKEQMFIYIGMSSPLRNQKFQMPKPNESPQDITSIAKPLDLSKCTYDIETTHVSINFDD